MLRFARSGCGKLRFAKSGSGSMRFTRKVDLELEVCHEWIREYEVLSERWILRFARSGCRILRFAKEVDNGD